VTLDGLNVALAIHAPGPMGEGNWAVGAYIDERADAKQTEALGAIFTGAAGGPMAAFAPLISKNLGVKKVPITYRVDGKKRLAEIPNILHMSVDPLPTMHPNGEMWASTGHPISPDKLAFAEAQRGARSAITVCDGIIRARTGITRRSAGPIIGPGNKVGQFAIQRSGEVPLNRANSWVHRRDRIPPSIKWEFLLPLFRSKINPHPAVTTRPEAPKPVVTAG
jgi:hypothetical protein